MSDLERGLRIDKWLWYCRQYKSRNAAAEAVAGGRVHLNGERVKPSHSVRTGDVIELSKDRFRWRLRVLGMPPRRGPAAEAARYYDEDEASRQAREALRESLRLQRAATPVTAGRPDKHTRRRLRRMQRED